MGGLRPLAFHQTNIGPAGVMSIRGRSEEDLVALSRRRGEARARFGNVVLQGEGIQANCTTGNP